MSLTQSTGSIQAMAEALPVVDGQSPVPAFWRDDEWALSESFLTEGHVICEVEDQAALTSIRGFVAKTAASWLQVPLPSSDMDSPAITAFLDDIHETIEPPRLNDFRLHIIQAMAAAPWLRDAYFRLARRTLEILIGNELAIQKRVNLSIQMPADTSSLLPVHADVWSGDSPYELVLWVPLVHCYGTKSMYLLPPAANESAEKNFERFDGQSTDALFDAIADKVRWIDIRYGEVMVFTQNLMHGNRVNKEVGTRWSMNCRFKSLLSPYAGKRLGEFFEPIVIRPTTRLGMNYQLPGNFTE